jgi:hypothetical protein
MSQKSWQAGQIFVKALARAPVPEVMRFRWPIGLNSFAGTVL